jgi:rRNA maturation RNase YbeY
MKINLEINNTTDSPVADAFFEAAAEKTFEEADIIFLRNCTVSISLALVGPEDIRKMNKEYRKNDSVTDVLSFAEYETLEDIEKAAGADKNNGIFLGELVLCYNDIKEYVEKEKIELDNELARIFSHGVLHLLGYGHGERMFSLQEAVAESLINTNKKQ